MRIGIDARKIADYGIGTYIRGLLRGLEEIRGEEEYVVFAPAMTRGSIPAEFEHVVIDAPHYSVRELVLIGGAIGRARLDLFHAPHYVVPLTRCRTIVTIHDLIHLHQSHRNPLKPLYARTMIGRAIRKCVRVLTVTETVRREIVDTFECDERKVVVTPNGVDPRFSPAGPRRDGTYFLFVGNDKPHKNAGRLIEAFARVRASRADLRLILAGSPFVRFGLREGVEIAGFVGDEELAALYRGALALVIPSVEEGFGLPAIEAMACGTAVVTSTAAALVEVAADAALHVNPHSIDEIAGAMLRVANDGALRRALASRGIERAREFTWRRCAEKTRATYLEAPSS